MGESKDVDVEMNVRIGIGSSNDIEFPGPHATSPVALSRVTSGMVSVGVGT